MSDKEILEIVFIYREDIRNQWGLLITVNIAIWGWLISRRGLVNRTEKIIATLAYSAFAFMISVEMHKVYILLEYTANELFNYLQSTGNLETLSEHGILNYYVSRSPLFCQAYAEKGSMINGACTPYSEGFHVAFSYILLSWVFNLILFWSRWLSVQEKE